MRISDWSSDVCSSDLANSIEDGWHLSAAESSRVPHATCHGPKAHGTVSRLGFSPAAAKWNDMVRVGHPGFISRGGRRVSDSPWGEGATTLEWTISSPPPYHQFETLPEIKRTEERSVGKGGVSKC